MIDWEKAGAEMAAYIQDHPEEFAHMPVCEGEQLPLADKEEILQSLSNRVSDDG